jgi:monoamine oxidase
VIDVAVVGGGAAGIAAATEAREHGLSAVILEASDRIGGRAWAVDWRDHALDLGATWLHSAKRNPLVPFAKSMGLALDRAPSRWRDQFHDLGFSKEEQAQSRTALEGFLDRLRNLPAGRDRASDALKPDGEWNGYVNAISGYLNGAGLAQVSARDFIAYWDASGDENWRVPLGMGNFVGLLGKHMELRTGVRVQRVDVLAANTRLTSDRGTVEARHVVIAVPTSVLARGEIAFAPAVDDKLHAASQLPLGHVEKAFFELPDVSSYPDGGHLIGNPRSADTGSYMLRPLGMPVIEGFFGGDWLNGLHPRDVAEKGREELGRLLGSDFARKLRPIAQSDWQRHPFICGSYSFARPGAHGARAALAEPVNERLAFAGEACSETDYATVHGAWTSGIAAVQSLCGKPTNRAERKKD